MKNSSFLKVSALIVLLTGCATGGGPANGIGVDGKKVYLGPVPIENTDAFKTYLNSPHSEVDKQQYLFQRLKASNDLSYFHDGTWYGALEAYRGGMWLMRKRYQKGQNTRDFIRKYVERSEDTGKLHLVKYPDGSTQVGSYVLYNELDLLEEAAKKSS